jgi:GNAT superfamily N-acetyltransferase
LVIHLRKQLVEPPVVQEVHGISLRAMRVPEDVPAWLELRERAVADLKPKPRPWLQADYAAELLDRPWWQAERNWLATATGSRSAAGAESSEEIIGAVTLAIRGGDAAHLPVIHWLLVDPKWQRRGIARLLVAQLERAAWDANYREVQLETHTGWSAAVAFYQSIGYEPARGTAR